MKATASNRILWVVLSLVLLATGCRSAINPHVFPTFPEDCNDPQKECPNLPTQNFEQVVEGAVGLRDRYRKAVGDQAKLQNILGLALLPVGVATAFIGGTSSHSGNDPVVALSLISAAVTTGGLRLTSRDRDFLYLLGSEGISCSLEAATPLMIDSSQREELKKLDQFSTLIATVDGCLPDLPADAAGQVEKARNVLGEAVKLQSTRLQAANHLRESVERISDQVNTGVISTRASLVTIQESVQGLANMAKGFRTFDVGAPQPGRGAGGRTLRTRPPPKDSCQQKLADMRQQAFLLNAIVATVDVKAKDLDLSACGVTLPKTGPRFSPDTEMNFIVQMDSSQTRLLAGGEPPYKLWLTESVEGLRIETNQLTYVTLVADGTKLTRTGDFGLLLTDTTGSGDAATLEVHVKENQRPTASPPDDPVRKLSNKPFTIQVRGSDPEGQKLTFKKVKDPDPNKGMLADGKCDGADRAEAAVPNSFNYCYTPKNPEADEFQFKVVDGAGLQSSDATVDIQANQSPTASIQDRVQTAPGEEKFEIAGTDPENQTLEFETSDVTNGTLTIEAGEGPNSRKVTFTLNDGQNEGSFKFNFVDNFGQKSNCPTSAGPKCDVDATVKRNLPPTANPVGPIETSSGVAEFEIIGNDPENQALAFCDGFNAEGGQVESVQEASPNSWKVTVSLDDQKESGSFTFCVEDDFKQKGEVTVEVVRKNNP